VQAYCYTPIKYQSVTRAHMGHSAGETALGFHSGHRNNVFQAKTLPESADKTIVTCAADGQVNFSGTALSHQLSYLACIEWQAANTLPSFVT